MTPPPEMLKMYQGLNTTGYLNCPLENRLVVFQSSCLLSWELENHPGAVVSIKPRLFLIWSDLDSNLV